MRSYRSQSFWFDNLPEEVTPRPALAGPTEVDVAIVGAGFTGLWTAYYLARLRPELRVAVLESEVAGYGASGRNGGWCSAGLAGLEGLLQRPDRRAEGLALKRAMFDSVDEVGRVCADEDIDCHYQKGGSLRVATSPPQLAALQHNLRELASWGLGEADYRWLEPRECADRARIAHSLGAVLTPHCAALHPARLVRGLARVVESNGVQIFERTRATAIAPRSVVTDRGEVRAELVFRATEAYTRGFAAKRRQLVPLHSLMIATEPLPDELWKEIGLAARETFGDARRIVIYGQRTADGRLAFGGRAGYRFGSGIEDRFDASDPRFGAIHRALLQLFPVLEAVDITHRWGGALGVARSWRPSVGLDRRSGLAWAGGYVGEGVAASNLAGRTLAELIANTDSERCRLAWVGREARPWEPEPLRWLAVSALTRIGESADRTELATGRVPRLRAALFDLVVGK